MWVGLTGSGTGPPIDEMVPLRRAPAPARDRLVELEHDARDLGVGERPNRRHRPQSRCATGPCPLW